MYIDEANICQILLQFQSKLSVVDHYAHLLIGLYHYPVDGEGVFFIFGLPPRLF